MRVCVRFCVCVCVCVCAFVCYSLKKCTEYTEPKRFLGRFDSDRGRKLNQNKVMKLTNLQRAIIASCALILLLGACALIAKAEWGRSLILVVPAIVGLLVADGKKQIKWET